MSRYLFVAFIISEFFFGNKAVAQCPVSSTPQNRKVLLEQFTGIHCTSCPSAHRLADSLKSVKPAGSLFIVNIHTGGLASPNPGEPDLRTSDGAAIAAVNGMNVNAYPSGAINRKTFGSNTAYAVSPSQWNAYIDSIQSQPSRYNIAFDATLDVNTRKLYVRVEVFGQSNAVNDNYLNMNLFLLEEDVSGPQFGAVAYPALINPIDSSYKHNYTLRKNLSYPMVNGGPPNALYAPGNNGYQSYYYTVPLQFANSPTSLGNLRLVAFITERDSNVITAATGPISLTGFPHSKDAELTSDIRIEKEVCEATLKPIVRIYNGGSQPITSASLQSSLNGGPFLPAGAFSGSIAPATSALVAVPPIGFSPNASNDVKFKIVAVNGSPDSNPANDTVSVSNILRTTRTSKGKYQVMRFTQDRWGSESTWKIVEEGTGLVKLAGGPYATLNNNGTVVHVDSFLAAPEQCYEIVVNDAGGNGINSGSGTGSYRVTSNGLVVYASNGSFGNRDRALFKTVENLTELPSGLAGLPEFDQSVSLAPNPTAGETRLYFSLSKGTRLSIQVVDMTGRVVAQLADQNLSAGSHALPVSTANLAGGVYNIRLATGEGVVTRRLVVMK